MSEYKVLRGGSWLNASAEYLRVGSRDRSDAALGDNGVGFRLVRDIKLELDPTGKEEGQIRVLRGGSWGRSLAKYLRVGFRSGSGAALGDLNFGFRVARN